MSSKSEHLRAELIAAIERGDYRPGERLPTVRELGRRFGLSHVVAASALDHLVAAGYVTKRQGAGTFVADLAQGHPGTLMIYFAYGPSPLVMAAWERFVQHYPYVRLRTCKQPGEADLLVIGPSGINQHTRLLQSLDERLAAAGLGAADFVLRPMEVGRRFGPVQALPYLASIETLFCRRALIGPALARDLPYWSVGELVNVAAELSARLTPRGICPLNQNRSFSTQVLAYFGQFGARVVDESRARCLLATPASLAAFTHNLELHRALAPWQPGEQHTFNHFTDGTLALYHGASQLWHLWHGRRDITLAPMVCGQHPASRLSGHWLGLPGTSRNPTLAWQFIQHLVSPAEQRLLAVNHYLFPGRRDACTHLLRLGRGRYDALARTLLTREELID